MSGPKKSTPGAVPGTEGKQSTVTPGAPGQASDQQDGGDVEGNLSLPHERDQSSHMTDGVPSGKVRQAAKDVERGLQDTSKAPEMDRAYKKQR